MKSNRIYVYKDLATDKEKECSESAAITILASMQYLNGTIPRFQFLRSFIPKVIAVKKIRRSDGQSKQTFEKISKVEETEISTIPPKVSRRGGVFKLETTWLGRSGEELAGAPDSYADFQHGKNR